MASLPSKEVKNAEIGLAVDGARSHNRGQQAYHWLPKETRKLTVPFISFEVT